MACGRPFQARTLNHPLCVEIQPETGIRTTPESGVAGLSRRNQWFLRILRINLLLLPLRAAREYAIVTVL
jgi:hypothetical protein